jgi:DEAD/DEAH box helicase domain-containing protein
MGLDIGDLSSVLLCGVPPSQSQYAQRTGRAGRRDGNSLIVTVVNATPHDLYFHAAPMEIMAAPIEPPKIFLKASAVLERQFVAYCLDSWVKSGVNINAVPDNIGKCLSNQNYRKPNKFPQNFLGFVKNHIDTLLNTFLDMFPELREDNDDSYKDIELFAKGSFEEINTITHKVQNVFDALFNQYEKISQNVLELQKKINHLMVNQTSQNETLEINDLRSENKALNKLIETLKYKEVFSLLTDEGLLPNYAFPESGVVLNGILYRKEKSSEPSKTGDKSFPSRNKENDKQVYEFNRPSSLALTELAPGNKFYAAGHKFTIDQLDLNTDLITKWRLCPSCSHAQLAETGKNTACCPFCGSPMWIDSGQERSLIKVNTVYSNMDFARSLIGNETEDRQRSYYMRKTLVDIDEKNDILKSYTIKNDNFTFAYEFLKKAKIIDINFGELSDIGDTLTVQGQQITCKGFVVCKHCGKVQDDLKNPKHTIFCPARFMINDQNSVFTDSLFLYRELSTEAMRILVPATTLENSNIALESFIAAFKLGMKGYFGNVEHLYSTLSTLPVPGTNYRKQYLVVYDGVPGGTGYLKQLMRDKHSMISILEKAVSLMENCSCKDDPSKDGCYRCLYFYKQSQYISQISRTKAIELLSQILSGRDNLEETSNSLSNLEVKDLLESELERRFIEAFTHMSTAERSITLTREIIRDKEGFRLEIGQNKEKVVWLIEPQVKLGLAEGVSEHTIPDFVFWPTRDLDTVKPIAVYTDGFTYHKDNVTDDTLKRAAVVRSGEFKVWSLTWSDVEGVFSAQGNQGDLILNPTSMPSGEKVYIRTALNYHDASIIWPQKASAMELFIFYLQNQKSINIFQSHSRAYAFSLLDGKKIKDEGAFKAWHEAVPKFEYGLEIEPPLFGFTKSLFGSWRPHPESNIEVLAGYPINGDPEVNKSLGPFVWAILEDREEIRGKDYEKDWQEFWHFSNIMRFNERFMALTRSGLENMLYGSPLSAESSSTSDWSKVIDLIFEPQVKSFAIKCSEMNLPAPDSVGFELIGPNGAVIGEAELTWSSKKIALLLPEQKTNESLLVLKDWRIISSDEKLNPNWFI